MNDRETISANLKDINERIQAACDKSGRTRESVMLLGVTKTIDTERIQIALENGITDIGENRVQEFLQKYDSLNANWHIIGHLQTNKVRQIMGKVTLIHSLESLSLAEEIDKRAGLAGKTQDVLVEINIGKEESKFGIFPEKAKDFVQSLGDFRSLRVRGLMCVAPFVDDGEKNRDLFKKMRNLFIDINETTLHNSPMEILSMGMTGDYETAIEEGATIVRIGTGVFGTRD